MADEYNDRGFGQDRAAEDAEAARTPDPVKIEEPSRPKTPREREEEKKRRLAELEEEARRKKEEERVAQELEQRRIKRKLIAPAVTLGVGAVSSIAMFLAHFDNRTMLIWLLVILIAAWLAGSLIQYMFERFAYVNEHTLSEEGEVINKGMVPAEEMKAEENG